MNRLLLLLSALLMLAPTASHAAPGQTLVRLDTSEGVIIVALESRRAPISSANFLAYVDAGRFTNTSFYRAARQKGAPQQGLIQGGIRHRLTRAFLPIKHEPTSLTGLKHVDGTLSMARNAPGTAMGDFFITIGPAPSLDASGPYVGYAAFGHVVRGMDVVKRILAKPTYPGGYTATTKGQSIIKPVVIRTATRVK